MFVLYDNLILINFISFEEDIIKKKSLKFIVGVTMYLWNQQLSNFWHSKRQTELKTEQKSQTQYFGEVLRSDEARVCRQCSRHFGVPSH